MKTKNWIKWYRDAFATDENWETVCEEVGADPETTISVKIYFDADEAETEEEDDRQ